MECRCNADPAPTFTWSQGTRELKAKIGKFEMQDSKDGAIFVNKLKIISFMNADAGTYKLTAKNTAGEAVAVMEIKMPKIVGMPNVRFEDNNQRAVLEVRVDSGNPPEAKWSHSGKAINIEGRYSSESTLEGKNHVLTEKDSGLYECEIFNGVGKVQQSITLKVPGKSILPISLFHHSIIMLRTVCIFHPYCSKNLRSCKVVVYLLFFMLTTSKSINLTPLMDQHNILSKYY
ncbi:unnamed protein product [Trichobilharzia regenti]|nr:unnamed protein product [Trichobilharzia regenti]